VLVAGEAVLPADRRKSLAMIGISTGSAGGVWSFAALARLCRDTTIDDSEVGKE
jgi:hypothetical protein